MPAVRRLTEVVNWWLTKNSATVKPVLSSVRQISKTIRLTYLVVKANAQNKKTIQQPSLISPWQKKSK